MSLPPIPEHVLKNGPWSISKAGTIEKCSLQYDFKYGPNKIKEVKPSDESRLGVAVHTALEYALTGTAVKLAFQIAADEKELTTDEVEQLQAFFDQVDRFVKKMLILRQKQGVMPQNVLIEKQWALTPDFKGTGFFDKRLPPFFRGVVDYALITRGNDVIIIDHKSGKQKDLSYYETQFRSYALMALAHIPELRGVQTAINFIQTDKLEWNPYVKASVIRETYMPWLIEHLTKCCEGLLAPPVAKKGWYCDWCGYKPICPAFGGSGRADTQGK
jgi:CRISPR/Cas system-associated exonuclease Cas4 (RecB family)